MSQFVVSARKYRPMRFEDVVGQTHVSHTLKNALQSGQVAHAFLFCGPRGVGKTTCARILAKVLNCLDRTPDFEACNTCSSCTAFNENASFNISELDAASNNSVENIRSLVEQVRIPPQQGKYKVYIIDEVHMLSTQAFNAFLKTLEEPPSYAIFILATTEKHKIIPTILSRCQIYDFRRISAADAAAHLDKICKLEGIDADSDALHIIGQKSDGALRDALSIFDRVVSASGKRLRYADVIDNLNILDYDYFFRVMDALLTEDMSKILLIFNDILRKGFDADIFLNGLAGHIRNLLVSKDPITLTLLESGENLRERYRQQAAISSTMLLLSALNIANEADVNYKMARNKPLHVEMALIKMTFIQRAATSYASGQSIAPEKKKLDISKTASVGATSPTITTEPTAPPIQAGIAPNASLPPSGAAAQSAAAHSIPNDSLGEFAMSNISIKNMQQQVDEEERSQAEKAQDLTFDLLLTFWQDYLSEASSFANAALKNAVLTLEGKKITITVPSEAAKGYLAQDLPQLRDSIRNEVHVADLQFEMLVDYANMPVNTAQPKRLMTPKEKYQQMAAINPVLSDLRQRFDLRPDNDN